MPGPFTDAGWLTELSRYNSRPISGQALLPTFRATNELPGSYKVSGRAHILDTSAAILAGRVQEYGETFALGSGADVHEGMRFALSYPTIVEGWFGMDGIGQTGFPNGDSFVGFGFGTLNQNTPFPAAPGGGGCIEVRFHRPSAQVQLYTCRGDGVTNSATVVVPLGVDLTALYNAAIRVRLELYPAIPLVRLTIGDLGDGTVKIVEQTDPTRLPWIGGTWANLLGFKWILCTGALAAGHQIAFSNFWIHTIRSDWGEL